ncbi:MAG: transglutaminase family protein [Rhodobiaceae bacterium]|nr:transglutaminase family protein [Rhodobiaceae bacterium]MCC0056132.1 transglutaminase family protein [Rhodobiaceae bacterium]
MLYDIKLEIDYEYDMVATVGRHLVHLMPANLPGRQRLISGYLTIEPTPAERADRTDYFGNSVVEATLLAPHQSAIFRVQARVERYDDAPGLDVSAPLALLGDQIAAIRSMDSMSPHHFLYASPRVALNRDMTAYAREVTAGAATTFSAVSAVNSALNRYMEFDPEATTVETSPEDAFERRRGVCQDFTHIMIACLRGIGIPAGYVSGYLRTIPPPGAEKLEGADAMHAWVRAWCGQDMGWIDFDPTNNLIVGSDHIVVGWGRDYGDVAPVRGITRTAGDQQSTQSVDVNPVERL